MIYRYVLTLLLVLISFFLPWWFSFSLIFFGLLIFPFYIESIIPLLVLDFLFGLPQSGFFTGQFTFTIIGCFLLIILPYLKERLLVYN